MIAVARERSPTSRRLRATVTWRIVDVVARTHARGRDRDGFVAAVSD
jgi:hypothetical protein